MSASLVGSEMCIRDRATAPRQRAQHYVISGRPTSARPGAPSSRAGLPVSYTHLTLPTICSV
eukprot:13237401-Alexandrium_andersonii.AAC.1